MHGPTELIVYIYNYSTSHCSGPTETISYDLECDSDVDDIPPPDFYGDDNIDTCCSEYLKNRYNITPDTCNNYDGYSLEISCIEEPRQYMFFIIFFLCCTMVVFTICVCFWIHPKKRIHNLDEKTRLIK